MTEKVKTAKSKVFVEKNPSLKDEYHFVTHLEEKNNADLLHNPVSGEYKIEACACGDEQ